MKIKLEIDDTLQEEEVVIRCRELNEEIIALQKQLSESVQTKMQLHVTRGELEYFLSLDEILFLETADSSVAVHTADGIFSTKQRLYELEELLPRNFMRVSKSTIISTSKIRAIHKNITGASEVEFADTSKNAFVSRSYIKALMERLEEKRLKS